MTSNGGAGSRSGLARNLGLMGLAATGICSMLGAAINVMPFALLRGIPEIGPYVLPAYVFAALPAVLAALAYGSLGSAMPRAGGSYVYASRALSPWWGFIASFSQWFGLSIAIGVVSYLLVPFIRDMAGALGYSAVAAALERGPVRVGISIAFLWTFVLVNVRGLKLYERTLVPMMFLMFALGGVVIVSGFAFDHGDFAAALMASEGRSVPDAPATPLQLVPFVTAAVVLFATFIGFDSIAQAGGEAKNPGRNIPLAIGIAIASVGGFYFLFTAAMYHAVPWQFVAEEAAVRDVTAPGLLGYLLPAAGTAAILAGAAVALINDLPAMLLAVSRMMFAWAEDGIFPKGVATVHRSFHTPWVAILLSGTMATVGIVGSHLAGDFFLGIDILVTSMLVNFGLICLSLVTLPRRNPDLAADVKVLGRPAQVLVGGGGAAILGLFLVLHIVKDLSTETAAWYFHSTWVWLLVMGVASLIYLREMTRLRGRGVDTDRLFRALPPE
ncbi:MAG: APC family permease [Acidobacteria bacterium]|nr:APC family permease [Acidobacteriota bacterium]MYH20995.1 APC family permease [Acidobacteriota bacterium]MYK79573.1 APC family permease [Acidobacteriota bacterium]